jgi:beta-lactamase regulating signal transducer with metallopeptidase domain
MSAHLLSPLADHLVLVCVGLLAAAALAWPARALLKRDPQSCYQFLLALLAGAVAVLPLQLLVQGRAAPLAGPAREWLRSLVRPAVERAREPAAPQAEPLPFRTFLVDAEAAAPPAGERPATDSTTERSSAGSIDPSPAAGERAASAAAPLFVSRVTAAAESAGCAVAELSRRIGWERAIAGAWLLGVALIASRRLLRAVRTLRLVASARRVDDPVILALWRRVGAGSRIAAHVRLVAAAVESPACTGLFRRVLILPSSPARPLAPEVLEWALRHELVHLERGDQWAALFQSAVTALLWFHPAAWWLSGEIGRLRELSCDQRVVETSGRRRSYALALLECAASCSEPITTAIDAEPHSAGVRCALLHWSRSPSQIRRRIEMLTVETRSLPRGRKALGIVVAGCALALPALAQLAGAATLLPARQQAPAPPPVPATPQVAPAGATTPAPLPDPSLAPPAPPTPFVPTGDGPAVGVPMVPLDQTLALPPQPPCPPAVGVAPTAIVDDDGDGLADLQVANGVCVAGPCDGAGQQYADAVRAEVRAAQRQIEAALRQVQRAQSSQQSGVKRQLDQLRRQVERTRAQQEKRRAALGDRIAQEEDAGRRADLEKELVALEADAERLSTESERRSEELEASLARFDDSELADCFESLGDYQQTMDGQVSELAASVGELVQQSMQAAQQAEQQAAQRAKLRKAGDKVESSDQDDEERAKAEKLRKLDAEKIAKKARAAAQKARAQLEQSLARAGKCGALNESTQRQIDEALARVEQVDSEKIRQAIERAVAAAKRSALAANRAAGEAEENAAPRMPRAGAKPRTPTPPSAPKVVEPPAAGMGLGPARPGRGDGHPRGAGPGGGVDEARLLEKISALEAEIEQLRAELEQLRAAPPPPADPSQQPPAKRVRTMR